MPGRRPANQPQPPARLGETDITQAPLPTSGNVMSIVLPASKPLKSSRRHTDDRHDVAPLSVSVRPATWGSAAK